VRVGFVGIGKLGGRLAARLVTAGFEVVAHDRDETRSAPLRSLGAAWAASPGEAARGAEAVITCLPSPTASTEVVASEGGVLDALAAGATWIEMSTTDGHELVRVGGLASERGIATLEAPVTGGVHLAATGELTVIVGGDPAVAEAHMPLFRAMGRRVFHVGPLGRATELKLITNMLAFVHLVADGEALMLARRAGLDLAQAWEVIAASSGTSFVHETEGQVILNGSYDIGFTLDLALKDLGLALQLGADTGVPLALAEQADKALEEARERYGGSAWSPMVVKLLEDAVGTDLRAPGFPATLEPSE
jgi:3-hydroxyisobutyrate dehydrogenase-like beta-hydroxyacid dehydrogenase